MINFGAFWAGGQLSYIENLCLKSLADVGYKVSLFTYDRGLQTPKGVEKRAADDILPQSALFENGRRPGTFSGFSALFRYRMIAKTDLVWVDADCLAGPRPMEDRDFIVGWENRRYVNNAVLRIPRDSELLEYIEAKAWNSNPQNAEWGELGPKLVSSSLRDFGLTGEVTPRASFYAIPSTKAWWFFDPRKTEKVAARTSSSQLIHLWNEAFRSTQVKSFAPPKGSFIDLAMEKHGVLAPSSSELDLTWLRSTWRPQIDPPPFSVRFWQRRAPSVFDPKSKAA